jgi:tRNA threonylcarbamoyladenosine biosynthesis protein TsaB
MRKVVDMKILAIDSSGLVVSVAILTEDTLLAEYTVNYKKTHSQTLLSMLDEIVRMIELDLSEINAIAVAKGPGSFTGLRIGSATAKGLGQALNKPLIGIPTVDALAYNMFACDYIVCPLMDARRNQVYTGLYEFRGNEFITIEEQQAVDVTTIVDKINKCGKPVVYLGDGVDSYRDQLISLTKVPHLFAPSHLNKQRAAALGALAVEYYKQGLVETAMEHVPDYLRLSQAEREREEAMKTE